MKSSLTVGGMALSLYQRCLRRALEFANTLEAFAALPLRSSRLLRNYSRIAAAEEVEDAGSPDSDPAASLRIRKGVMPLGERHQASRASLPPTWGLE